MSSSRANRALLAIGLALAVAAPAHAGRACVPREMGALAAADTFDAALRIKTWLDTASPEVALIARRGQNLDKYAVTYSHVAFLLRDATGGWTVLHDLNKCASDQANLFEQGLAEFFADDLESTQVAIVVPHPVLQAALKRNLAPAERFALHEAHYSAVAYPFSTQYQNSNGWVLETFARALSAQPLTTREEAQTFLQTQKYEPTVLDIGPLTRLGGRMFAVNIAFDDHPGALRWANKITVNSGDSLVKFTAQWAVEQPTCEHGSFGSTVCVVPAVSGKTIFQ